jgi:hypothetical protein
MQRLKNRVAEPKMAGRLVRETARLTHSSGKHCPLVRTKRTKCGSKAGPKRVRSGSKAGLTAGERERELASGTKTRGGIVRD